MKEKKRHASLDRLLDVARVAKVEGPAALAAALAESEQTVTNWGSRGVSKSGAMKAQEKFGCNANWILTGHGANITLPAFTIDAKGGPIVTLEAAVERIAKHFEAMSDYDRGTAVSLMTTLARSPYMHASVASGLVEMEKRARDGPANKPPPAMSRAA